LHDGELETPLCSFERLLSPSRMPVGAKGGLGCFSEAMPDGERQTGVAIPDQFRHEIATVYNLKGRGLVVLTSCSHRGVFHIQRRCEGLASALSRLAQGATSRRKTLQARIGRAGQRDPDHELAAQLALARQSETRAHGLSHPQSRDSPHRKSIEF
jgi:hypothetical protein